MPLELLERSDLDPEDFLDSYDLPGTVATTIPRCADDEEPTAYWVARGLLTETCDRLGAEPLSLDYIEHTHTVLISAHVVLPSRLPVSSTANGTDGAETVLTADLVLPRTGCRWTLLLDDHTIGTGAGLLPTPRWLADRIETAYNEDDYR